ncbi:hypothetical protein LAZ67_1002937 [Cordylochernes scorpioides]|uniref:DNA helicase Pif1-like 2B domain-containing protein n=1 Tax=Cordylochernes scorpioides TaxID=51811 RepID=A0ABY6JWJ6_9ARAC|nr:hypothetical protein LAZ67_1002937 [Cordylochernes scorpioides]
MRVHLQNDASAERFAKQLLNIGNGKMTIDPTSQCITLPTSFCTLTSSKEELIQKVFPNIAQNYRNLQWLSERAILAAKNIDVNDINFCVQNWVPGEERTYTSIDTMLNEDEAVNYPTEFLNCLHLPGFSPHVLQLKTGVPIILLRNINPPKLCNGTRLSVKTMMNNIIEATILNGKFKGQDVLLPRIPLFPPDLPFEFKRLQFPVRTAFSMTINKAQGQSLKVCGLNLEVPCFSHGQLYVASSRVGNPSNLYVYTPDKTGTYTCNSSNGLCRYLHLQQFQWFIQVPTPATVPMVYAAISRKDDAVNVINLSKTVLSKDEVNILSKGLKHRPIGKPQTVKIISGIEAAIEPNKMPPNNHRDKAALNDLKNRQDIIITSDDSQITHSEHPKYLGIHLDRTLTFKTHLTKLKGKLSSRNNILHKLAGSSWGSDANTLRTSALALIFSTAEYCAPVWEGSCHTKLIDTQLNSTLRIITGVCQPTRIDWLPVLAHISPPELRRKEATKKMYQKLLDSPDLEINPILQSPPKHRLKSRNPIWSRGNQLLSQNFNISEAWTNSWISSDIPNKNLITSPSVKIPGFSLPRREWVLLNRFRTGQGRCAELMKLWGYTKDPNCACNIPQSMSHILDDCPLYKFNGGISNLHSVTPEALNWLKALPLRL